MTVIRALANRTHSIASDRRDPAALQEVHRYCPIFATRLGGNFAAIQYWPDGLVFQGGIRWAVAMSVVVIRYYDSQYESE